MGVQRKRQTPNPVRERSRRVQENACGYSKPLFRFSLFDCGCNQTAMRILFESKAVPIKHLIAAPRMSMDDIEKVRALFLGLETSRENRKFLDKIGFQGFIAGNEKALAEFAVWLGI